MRKPATGEPYAGKPPVRFGGRGGQKPSLPLSVERLAFAGRRLTPLRLARRRAEQRLLQILEAFGKPRPVAGECISRASRNLRMRPDVVHGCRWLALRHHPSPCPNPFTLLRPLFLS